ncbi:MAG: hypothetical protein CL512_05685 [Actinobacteria bacterium]|nr:hypothetical protein [Actinomycetota bacterium]|tara:strand:- start:485 stop:694 length:210 start_codon:yes stop_codon:yes gene_type:complete
MIDYIKEYCQLPPLERPLYDEDSDTWDLWFEEKPCSWYPYSQEGELICLSYETKQEAESDYSASLVTEE